MADTVQMFDHWNSRFAHQPFDQTLAAARHDDINVILHRDQFTDGRTVRGRDDLHCGFRQPGGFEAGLHAGGNRLVRMQRFRTAAQDRGIAGFQAQPGRVRRHVRT